MIQITPEYVLGFLQALIFLLLTLNYRAMACIRDELRKINGRIGRLEQWSADHEKLDDGRHVGHKEQIDSLWGRISP